MKHSALVLICISTLCGCATTPPDLQGNFTRVSVRDGIEPAAIGQNVRWGGQVVGARDIGTAACVEVVAYRLAPNDARPEELAFTSENRKFVACGAPNFTRDETRDGAFVTFTGVIGTPLVIDTSEKYCRGGSTPDYKMSYYKKTAISVHDGICTVTLAKLDVASVRVWPEMPAPKWW